MGFPAIFRRRPRTDLATEVVQGDGQRATGLVAHSVAEKFAIRSMVSAGMTIDGNISSDTGAAVDGRVNGNVTVHGTNCALLIRESAMVRGNVRAPIAMVRGHVHGDIDARFVRLFPGARVNGKIRSARMIVDDGAIISNDEVAVGSDDDGGPGPRGNSGVLEFNPAAGLRSVS